MDNKTKSFKQLADEVTIPDSESEVMFPEGGLRAWSVVAGAFFASFATLGWVTSFGAFQSYYEQNVLNYESASNVAWIGSMQYGLVRFPAFLTGWLLDRGYYNGPFATSSILYVLFLFLLAECKSYWQFALCQGFGTGFFAGMLFGTIPAVLSHWFDKKLSLALGVFAVGSSVGGTVLPIATQQLLNKFSFQWSMRIMAFILGYCILMANLLIRPRLPPCAVRRGMFNFSVFKNPAFTLYVLAENAAFMGISVPISYLNSSALAAMGYSTSVTPYLMSIANCSSTLGRISAGYLADKYGPLNVLIPFTLVGAAASYTWPFAAGNLGCIIIISIIYGWTMGAFMALLPSAPIRMGGMEDAGSRVGMATTFVSFGGVGGLPLAGLVLAKSGGYTQVGVYAGSLIMLGCALFMISRRLALGQWSGNF